MFSPESRCDQTPVWVVDLTLRDFLIQLQISVLTQLVAYVDRARGAGAEGLRLYLPLLVMLSSQQALMACGTQLLIKLKYRAEARDGNFDASCCGND